MLVQIVTENGQKKVIPLTADAGAGLPVGFIAPAYKKGNYSGWLYLDGRDTTGTSEELSTHYPLLYAFLGSNILPDYREFALVGAEENTTDTIATHDVYAQGEGKDDQFQTHTHFVSSASGGSATVFGLQYSTNGLSARPALQFGPATYGDYPPRAGTVTRGKRKAVYFYIKATSGLSENAQDNVLAQLNEQRSYSTEEHLTGKKWIDGKPTYEITKLGNATFTNSAWTSIAFFDDNVSKHIVNVTGIIFNTNIRVNGADKDFTNVVRFAISDTTTITTDYQITLEYTKTT